MFKLAQTQPFVAIAASAWLLRESIDGKTLIVAVLVVIIVAIGKPMPVAVHDSSPD